MSNAVAKTNKELNDDLILGHLAFYTIGDLKIDEQTLERLFQKNNLPKRFIRKISKVDAFRRATSAANGTIEIDFNGKKVKAKLEVDEVRKDNSGIVRLLGRKVIDDNNAEVSYETVGRIDYTRGTGTISTSANTIFLNEYDYRSVLRDIENRYNEWAVYHTKDTIKNLTVNIVKSLYPVNLMPSGVAKFIPKTQKDYLFGLQGLIRDLSNYGAGNVFEVIPVIDTDEQRDLITRTADSDIRNELNGFISELKNVLTAKQIIPLQTAKTYVQKFNEMKNKVAEYEKLIGTYMTVIHTQIKNALEFVEVNSEEDSNTSTQE